MVLIASKDVNWQPKETLMDEVQSAILSSFQIFGLFTTQRFHFFPTKTWL